MTVKDFAEMLLRDFPPYLEVLVPLETSLEDGDEITTEHLPEPHQKGCVVYIEAGKRLTGRGYF